MVILMLRICLLQVMAHASVVSASVTQTGQGKTVTAPPAQIPACPAWDCCVVAVVSVCVEAVSVLNPGLMAQPVTSVPPALMPAL